MVPPTRADGIVPPTVTPDGHPVSRRERQERRRRHAGAIILGVFGEILITLGVILGLYVAWELVWTDVEANQEAIQVIQTVVDRPAWIHPDKNSPNAPHHDPADDPPPVDDNPLITPPLGETWAVLHVPRWGSDYVVPMVEGIDRPTILNKGLIGHYPGTAGPGRIGNFATAAHRTTYGKPYNRVAELENGDPLIVETDNYYFVYEVYGYEIVYPHEVRVIWPVPNEENAVPTKRIITLTTCHPMFSARQRYIVWGEMTYWVDKSEGQLDVLAEEG
jgi:sortase A